MATAREKTSKKKKAVVVEEELFDAPAPVEEITVPELTPESESSPVLKEDEDGVSVAPAVIQKPEDISSVKMVDVYVNYPLGIKYYLSDKITVSLRGNGHQLKKSTKGILPIGEYARTTIPLEYWKEIKKRWGNTKMFQNGLIFAARTTTDGEMIAGERKELRNGFEPAARETNDVQEVANSSLSE